MPAELDPTLEQALLRELLRSWRVFADRHFRGLSPPVIGLTKGEQRLGRWSSVSRTIRLSREMVLGEPWSVVLEVLKHEMAHQYVDEVLGCRDETAHGPAFRRLCARLAINASSAGLPAPDPNDPMGKVLDKVRKLLALAESPNEHEAQAAMNAAHRLMLKHNVAWSASAAQQTCTFRNLGSVKGRFQAHEKILAGLLARHFFVQVIWVVGYDPLSGLEGRIIEACGTPANLEIASYVHGFLLETGERLWHRHKSAFGIQGDRERLRFLAGMMLGFQDRLKRQAEECRQEGLVWLGDPSLESYFQARYPSVVHGRGPQIRTSAAWYHGRVAGQDIVIHRPLAQGSTERGRLLAGPDDEG